MTKRPVGRVLEDGHTAHCAWDKQARIDGRHRDPYYACHCPCHRAPDRETVAALQKAVGRLPEILRTMGDKVIQQNPRWDELPALLTEDEMAVFRALVFPVNRLGKRGRPRKETTP